MSYRDGGVPGQPPRTDCNFRLVLPQRSTVAGETLHKYLAPDIDLKSEWAKSPLKGDRECRGLAAPFDENRALAITAAKPRHRP